MQKQRIILAAWAMAALVAASTGCRPKQAVTGTVQRDSVATYKTETFRDTTIITPTAHVAAVIDLNDVLVPFKPDSGKVSAPVFKPITIEKNDKQARLTVAVDGSKLKVDCTCDSLAIAAKLRDTYAAQFFKSYRHDTVVETTNKVPGIVKFFAWSGGAAWLFLLIRIGIKLFKYFA